jgi:hypothetical protein
MLDVAELADLKPNFANFLVRIFTNEFRKFLDQVRGDRELVHGI